LDYILSGCVISINDFILKQTEYSKAAYPDSSNKFHHTNAYNDFTKYSQDFPPCEILKNYTKIVSKQQKKLNPSISKAQFIIVIIDMPSFKDRLKTDLKYNEKVVFASRLFDI
jgi:hypothetical protein